jgi:hypothetical protein
MTTVTLASLAGTVTLVALAGCGGSELTTPTGPPGAPASIRIISGAGQSDTVMSLLAPVVVEVRDSAGRRIQLSPVRFSAIGLEPDVTICSDASIASCDLSTYADTTVAGQASVKVRLGTVAEAVGISVTVPGTSLADTVTLTARPATPVSMTITPADSTAYAGNSYRLTGHVLDQYGNVSDDGAITFAESGAAATIGADGTFHAQAVGRAFAVAHSGSLVDTAWITVPPRGAIAAMDVLAPGGAKIVKVELDGSGYSQLSPVHDTYYGTEPDWISPSEVAFDDGDYGSERILVVDTLGAVRRLTAPTTPTIAEGFVAGGPGGVVYFDALGAENGTALWKVSTPGSVPVRIGPNPPGNANAWQATPSPDGQRLAYIDVNRGGLSILDIATGTMSPLNIAAATPRWSPLGDRIVFGNNGTLHFVNPDGSGLSDVAGGLPFDARADWSPNGAWLMVRSATRLELVDMSSGVILPLGWSSGIIRPAFRR